ncbi:PREDICTED: myelin protein P0-like [Poecilia mexicana]|uniref:myelin protein P0-like n=1 Tax=Poecilia mexicana TaxID=48701 RepID=UPI00072EEFA0|nr:PREDICTED: myelin protein P0-like [Poecilia mexicana]XP_014838956.1 PREDICTED: myelin protein P0-like [Poecilia mexicana]
MKSLIRRLWIFVIIPSVTCQDFVPGLVGKSAVLPCYSGSAAEKVFWRDKDDKNLLDINKGTPNPNLQHQRYKGRVSWSETEFKKKNYSIILGNLELDDTGTYECSVIIDGVGKHTKIKLEVMKSASCVSSSRIVLQTLVLCALSLIIY